MVFAGPSRPATMDGVTCLPPASAGDLLRVADAGARTIVLADTLFMDAPPPHSEIRLVLNRGVKIFGCASAGALRAIEMHQYGMRGVGWIYHLYRLRLLTDDGELASVLDSDYRAVTPPLVQIRYYLGQMVTSGWPLFRAAEVFSQIRSIYFMRRTPEAVAALINDCSSASVTPDSLLAPDKHIKSIDLLMCLSRLGAFRYSRVGKPKIDLSWLKVAVTLHRGP